MEEIPVRIYDKSIEGYNMRKYINTALCYSILAIAGGIFYREFTRFNGLVNKCFAWIPTLTSVSRQVIF